MGAYYLRPTENLIFKIMSLAVIPDILQLQAWRARAAAGDSGQQRGFPSFTITLIVYLLAWRHLSAQVVWTLIASIK
jgi:hypothetical protein